MAVVYSLHPRTTAERGECGDFVVRLRTREDLSKGVIFRIDEELVPVIDVFGKARAANSRTGSRATRSGVAFRAGSDGLRETIEAWMRAIDAAHKDTGYAEKHLRVHFGNRSLSRLWQRSARLRLETVVDFLPAVTEDRSLHGSDAALAKVRADLLVYDAALDAYDGALEARKTTVDALKAASAAFDFEYDGLTERLLRSEAFTRLVPRFSRAVKVEVPDPELELEPELDPASDADEAAPAEPTPADEVADPVPE